MTIPLSSPWITNVERDAVMAVLQTRHLALGPAGQSFESCCARLAGVDHAVALSSGTMALTLTARALGWGAGDEVLTPSFSFVASANTIMHVGAKPVFVDIDPVTWNMDPMASAAAVNTATRGIQVVDVFGQPCDLAAFEALAQKHDLDLIEDACEAVGAHHLDGRSCGAGGRAGTWAFYPNKQVTTGEGGVLLTNDGDLATHIRSLGNQGRGHTGGWFDNIRLGWNGRMSDLNAALGEAQLNRLDDILAARAHAAALYEERLASIEGVEAMPALERSWFVYVVRLAEASRRDEVIESLRSQQVQCSPYFAPIHLMPFMKETWGCCEGQLPVTEDLASRTLALPFFCELTEAQIDKVCSALKRAIS